MWQVAETLSQEVLSRMCAPLKSDVPIIASHQLPEAGGFVFGLPARFGMMAAQFKAFLDATGDQWRTQQLAGKPTGIFCCTALQGGGQETTPLTAITQLVHHGMIFVPIGYTLGAGMFEMEQVIGGSAYGAGTYAGDGSRQPSDLELEQLSTRAIILPPLPSNRRELPKFYPKQFGNFKIFGLQNIIPYYFSDCKKSSTLW